MYLVVVKDDLNIVRHQVSTGRIALAEDLKKHLESCQPEDFTVEIHYVKSLERLEKDVFDYPVVVMKDWEIEIIS